MPERKTAKFKHNPVKKAHAKKTGPDTGDGEGSRGGAATVWKGYLSFGLVTFPVRLHSAARAEGVHFHMLHKPDLSRVKEVWYCAEENKPIERSEIVKGYETSKGEYVVVEDSELKDIAPPTASTMDILQFVASNAVDPIYFESSYYVAAEEAVSKPYALFQAALTETKHDAIAKIAMHNREHVVIIRPTGDGLVLHTLFYVDELHRSHKTAAPKTNFTAQELTLAKNLISHLSAPFKPAEFHDTYRENVEHLIAQKKKGQTVTPVEQPRKAPVIDLMEALKRSLAAGGSKAKAEKPASAKTKKSPSRHRAA